MCEEPGSLTLVSCPILAVPAQPLLLSLPHILPSNPDPLACEPRVSWLSHGHFVQTQLSYPTPSFPMGWSGHLRTWGRCRGCLWGTDGGGGREAWWLRVIQSRCGRLHTAN